MTAASPWSVKGIDPKAREVAKDLARRSGMTLGEWLNRMIIEGDGQAADPRLAGDDAPNRAYLEIVKDDAPPRIEIAEHPADEIGRVALALDRLTQRLLELARAETAGPGGRCDAITVLKSLAQRQAELGHRLRLAGLPEAQELQVPAEVLDAALGTLLDNAYGHGGTEVSVNLRLGLEGQDACIEVANDGPGISAGNAERLFTPFFTTGRERGHTGLGLCIARALLRAHSGELWLASAAPVAFRLRCRRAAGSGG